MVDNSSWSTSQVHKDTTKEGSNDLFYICVENFGNSINGIVYLSNAKYENHRKFKIFENITIPAPGLDVMDMANSLTLKEARRGQII